MKDKKIVFTSVELNEDNNPKTVEKTGRIIYEYLRDGSTYFIVEIEKNKDWYHVSANLLLRESKSTTSYHM